MTKRLIERRNTEAEDLDDWGRRRPDKSALNGIVIGQIPRSGNYLLLGLTGKYRGGVFYASHEDSYSLGKPLARSFTALLDLIAADPAKFLRDVGCYTRYSNGKTDTQWSPNELITDVAQSTWIGWEFPSYILPETTNWNNRRVLLIRIVIRESLEAFPCALHSFVGRIELINPEADGVLGTSQQVEAIEETQQHGLTRSRRPTIQELIYQS
jgi:hypothetical protein